MPLHAHRLLKSAHVCDSQTVVSWIRFLVMPQELNICHTTMWKLWLKHLLPNPMPILMYYMNSILVLFYRHLTFINIIGHITGFSRLLTPAQWVCICVCVALASAPAVMVYCSGRCSCHWTGAEPVLPSANNLFLQERRGEKSSPAEIQHRFRAVGRDFHSKERWLIWEIKKTL